jgi:hypothetical protein
VSRPCRRRPSPRGSGTKPITFQRPLRSDRRRRTWAPGARSGGTSSSSDWAKGTFHLRALASLEKTLGADHPDVALARVLAKDPHERARVRALAEEAFGIYEAAGPLFERERAEIERFMKRRWTKHGK